MGYSWVVGNGKKIHFWEDQWFGNAPLSAQFWDLYSLANEHNISIYKIWDGIDLKINFRRCLRDDQISDWMDLVSIAGTITFKDCEDTPVWKYSANGQYSVKSFYNIVNFRGIFPVHTQHVWKLKIVPRVQIFLWLV